MHAQQRRFALDQCARRAPRDHRRRAREEGGPRRVKPARRLRRLERESRRAAVRRGARAAGRGERGRGRDARAGRRVRSLEQRQERRLDAGQAPEQHLAALDVARRGFHALREEAARVRRGAAGAVSAADAPVSEAAETPPARERDAELPPRLGRRGSRRVGGGVLGPRLRRDAAPRELHEDLGGGVEEAREPRRRARRAAVALVAVASVVAVERRFVYGVGLSAKEPLERVRRVARERPRRRGVERVEEPRRRKLMERVVEALGDAGRAGRVVRVSDQEARGPRAPRERRRGGALLPRDDGGAERGDARPRREEREQRLVQARCVELQGDAHDGRRLGRHAWAGCLLD